MSLDIPNYRVLEKLGSGQGSTLYKAVSVTTSQTYTLKYVKVLTPEEMRLVEQMKDEHTCGSSLDHPVLRKTYELRYVRRRLSLKGAMLFMEYVEGTTLTECAARLGLIELLRVAERVAEGLQAMHKGGFVHADLKPGNILILPGGDVKLIDFGQSSPINEAKRRIQGTIDYMAPEQAARQVLDARTDVFGLGATLHRAMTGQAVATEMNQRVDVHSLSRVGMRRAENMPPSLEELPVSLGKFITDCCASDPADRPRDMAEFIDRSALVRLILNKRQESENVKAASDPAAG